MQFEIVFSERRNKITSQILQISTSFILLRLHFIVVRISFIYVNQMFEFNKGGVKLAEYNCFPLINQASGFYDKLVFKKRFTCKWLKIFDCRRPL